MPKRRAGDHTQTRTKNFHLHSARYLVMLPSMTLRKCDGSWAVVDFVKRIHSSHRTTKQNWSIFFWSVVNRADKYEIKIDRILCKKNP